MQVVKMQIQRKVSFFHLDRIFNDPFPHLRDPTSFFHPINWFRVNKSANWVINSPPFDGQTNMSAFVDKKVGLIICLEAYVVYNVNL